MQFNHPSYLDYVTSSSSLQQQGAPPNSAMPYSLDHLQQQQQHQQQQRMAYPSIPGIQHGFPADVFATQQAATAVPPQAVPQVKPKRKQVKNACVNCQKACKKCDDARPCPRCIKYGLTATCVNSVRKERKKGVKRGPYKQQTASQAASQPTTPVPTNLSAVPAAAGNGADALLLNNSHPYIRTFHGTGTNPYHQAGAIMSPYTVPGIMQQIYPTGGEYQTQQQQQHAAASPVKQQAEPTTTTTTTSKETTSNSADSEDDGKLNILSQLCSAVLDHSDTPKEEVKHQEPAKKEPYALTTQQQQRPPATSMAYTHATAAAAPTSLYASASLDHTQQQQQQQQPPQQQLWPLPSLQSVVQPDRALYYQQQQQQHQQQQQPSDNANDNTNTPNQWNGSHWQLP
ncbi:hypothetical protein O0I10_003884 [Lichtheimia ornata]|uniref:Zn(2)-C6 fungal-type domain-containing protein n=1 Tax=Lichtheimia ornata TaxID=688661 RepID=A0AAD7Y0T7_9FUNG|nr:uncharacterized protein O0I10_003884 [Lichtheimia ornata]KAJ8660426.1 hypothetical protein O0I10_003884 [Lichtheimia ornata]